MEVRKYVRILLNIIVPILIAYLVCVWGIRLLAFFAPFVAGWIVATIANPVVHFLEKRIRIVRKHGSFVMIVGVLALVVLGLYFLIGWSMRELMILVGEVPDLYADFQSEIYNAYEELSDSIRFVPSDVQETLGTVIGSIGAGIGDWLQEVTAVAGGAVARTLPDVLVAVVMVCLSSYFFLAEHDKIVAKVRKILPASAKKYLALIKRDVRHVIGGYFLAQFRIMFVVALVLLVGFWFLGTSHSVLLAILIALLDFLPMFGTGTALIPWALLKLLTGDFGYACGLLLLYVLTQAVRQVIQPKIVGDSIGLPPLTTLFLLFIGYRFKGIAGMIVAVPIGMLVIKLYEYGIFDSVITNVKLLAVEVRKLMGDK